MGQAGSPALASTLHPDVFECGKPSGSGAEPQEPSLLPRRWLLPPTIRRSLNNQIQGVIGKTIHQGLGLKGIPEKLKPFRGIPIGRHDH